MTDLDNDALMLARGRYSTVRRQHEDAKKYLQILCGQLISCSSQILRHMQPDNEDIPGNIENIISDAQRNLNFINVSVSAITNLAQSRADLKKEAWGNK